MLRLIILLFCFYITTHLSAQVLSNSKVSSSTFVSDNSSFLLGDIVLHKDSGVLNSFGVQLFFEMTDIVDAVSLSDLVVYPNPTTDRVSIVSEQKINNIDITDMNGKLIKRIQNVHNDQDINVSEIQAGTYLLIVNNKESIKLSIAK